MTSWIVYTKVGGLPLWKSENKKDLELLIKKLPRSLNNRFYIVEEPGKKNV